MGEVKGNSEAQNAIGLSGALNAYKAIMYASIRGTVSGICNCWVSSAFSTAEPMAAKSDAYSRYPNRKNTR